MKTNQTAAVEAEKEKPTRLKKFSIYRFVSLINNARWNDDQLIKTKIINH